MSNWGYLRKTVRKCINLDSDNVKYKTYWSLLILDLAEANLESSIFMKYLFSPSVSGVLARLSLRTLFLPLSRCGLCLSVCCWVPVPCWWRRQASLYLECVCFTTPWCSAASLSSSKCTDICFVYILFLFVYLNSCGDNPLSIHIVFFSDTMLYICTTNRFYTRQLCTATIGNVFWRQKVCVSLRKFYTPIVGKKRTF